MVKKVLKTFTALILVAACLAGCGVSSSEKNDDSGRYSAEYYDCFDTVIVVTAYCDSQEEFDALSDQIHQKFLYYHKLFDIYHEYDGINNVCTINRAAGNGEDIKVAAELADTVYLGLYMCNHTKDSVNIAMGSVLRLWHEARETSLEDPEKAYIPDMEDLKAAAEHIDHKKVVLDLDNSTVRLDDPEMSLDLGSIGKGYAVKLVAEWLGSEGKTGVLINAGGNVQAVGRKSSVKSADGKALGDAWTVAVENPVEGSTDLYADTVLLEDRCLVTSGVDQRFFTYDGKRYHHIIDQQSLFPENRYLSVSVIYTDSGCADALSTALFNMDIEESKAFVEADPDLEALWILPGGNKTERKRYRAVKPGIHKATCCSRVAFFLYIWALYGDGSQYLAIRHSAKNASR